MLELYISDIGMKTIAIVNEKGGVGKSTSAISLYLGLLGRGHRTLFVDLDPQGNSSLYLNASHTRENNLLDAFKNAKAIINAIETTEFGDILPSTRKLLGAELENLKPNKEKRLANALDLVSNDYDFCVIDTPPTFNTLTINALTASDFVVIPTFADIWALQGVEQLKLNIDHIINTSNKKLKIAGILLTKYENRTLISRDIEQVAKDEAKKLGINIFKARIPNSVAIREAQVLRKNILEYAPKAKAIQAYKAFIKEVIREVNK